MIPDARRRQAIAAARSWIVASGIQIGDRRHPLHGAFQAWYDLEERAFGPVYPEITGYGVTLLLHLDGQRRDPGLLRRALAAGDWLARRALHSCGGVFPRSHYEPGRRRSAFSGRRVVVIFDSGMALFGLANLHRRTRRRRFLEAARRIGDFLVDKAMKRNGLLHAAFDPARARWVDGPSKWSTQSGGYHAKLALGLLRLHELTGAGKYRAGAEAVCAAAMTLQDRAGRFVSYRRTGATHMHPHLYSAEGLLAAGLALKRRDFVRSAAAAVRWSLSQQSGDGGLPCLVGPAGRDRGQRSDTLAQALRLAALCHGLGELPSASLKRLPALEKRLLSFQVLGGGRARTGGFLFGKDGSGPSRPHLNLWCTAFALQALEAYRGVVLEGQAPEMEHFV